MNDTPYFLSQITVTTSQQRRMQLSANMDDDDETTYETTMFLCFNFKIIFICVYWWTRQRIHIGGASSGIV